MKEPIRAWAMECGAAKCGFAAAGAVDPWAKSLYARWIETGRHGTMAYCERYCETRDDARLMWSPPSAQVRTIICCAFPYNPYSPENEPTRPLISRYALGNDYHFVLKDKLKQLGQRITDAFGGLTLPCVDTAPIRERYWAQKAGLGFIGLNNQLIIPGEGSYFFLGELLWTGEVEPDEPSLAECDHCGACIAACPGRALDGLGGCDARKCVSYLTIEHRGDLPDDAKLGTYAFGCDICQRVCPHNANAKPTTIAEFLPSSQIEGLTPEAIAALTPSQYKKLTQHSAMRRAPLKQLLRNIEHLRKGKNL